MSDKTEKVATFRDYFQEAKAREKSGTLREYMDRILLEESVRKTLDNLKEEGFSIMEGLIEVTPWRKTIKDFEKPDFTVSKEDILFQLYLLITEERGIIKKDFLRAVWDVLQMNPKVTALIFVWNNDDLPACALDPFILRKYIEKPEDRISLKAEEISKLELTIRDFYNSQFVDWSIPEDIAIGKETETTTLNLPDVLRRCLEQELKKLEEKRFIIPEKREAQGLVLKLDKEMILDKLINLLTKPGLTKNDFDDLESSLDKWLRKAKVADD